MGFHRQTDSTPDVTTRLRRLAALSGVSGVMLVAIAGWSAWSAIERVPFQDAVAATDVLETVPSSEVDALRAAEDATEEAARLAEQDELEAELLELLLLFRQEEQDAKLFWWNQAVSSGVQQQREVFLSPEFFMPGESR